MAAFEPGKDVRTISEHLRNLCEADELEPEATVRKFRNVQTDRSSRVSYDVEHCALRGILAAEEYAQFQAAQRALEANEAVSDFDRVVEAARRLGNKEGDT